MTMRVQAGVTARERVTAVAFLWAGDRSPVVRDLRRRAHKVAAAARVQAGKDTGRLARSIDVAPTTYRRGMPVVDVVATAPHARLVHEGTRPHVILPRRPGGVLRFPTARGIVFTRKVMHPGTRPNRFLSDNLWLAAGRTKAR